MVLIRRMERFCFIILLSLVSGIGGSGILGEEMMIYPVPSVSAEELSQPDRMLEYYSYVGRGHYEPLKLRDYTDKRIERFETSFEECAPMRNSAANEWSAFGAVGNMDFNAMGRQMWVRYPAFELVFRLYKDGKEIRPDSLDSFRLGLVNNRLPAIWGAWRDNELLYKVSVMTVPSEANGNYDLFKMEVQNPTDEVKRSDLVVALDGSPDLRLEDGVVRGLGDAAFMIADKPAGQELVLRDWGLCDKRARSYKRSARIHPGQDEPWVKKEWEEAVRTYRLGMDGLPVKYQFKAQAGKKYIVYLVSPLDIETYYGFYPHYYLQTPREIGDQIFEYRVEGCTPKKLDSIEHVRQNETMQKPARPMCVSVDGATDLNGDGYIEIQAGVASESRCRHSVLGVIYVFPEGTKIDNDAAVYGGKMNDPCVWHIDVGVTPEQERCNQNYNYIPHYDNSDIGFARLKLNYGKAVQPGEIQTYWLKVPPIHRREPVAMEFIGHAFRDVYPGEAVPPFDNKKVKALKQADPRADEQRTVDYWNAFFSQAAIFDVPDPVLNDIYLSRLATRAILDIKINDQVWYNACSPFFYFDQSYRDACYHILARDYAGLYGEAQKLINVYCMDVEDVKDTGPIWFKGEPIQLGMREDGLWLTRPRQFDTQGQNLWALVEHYKLTGERDWLENTAYPFIRRGAMWIVNSRHKHMKEVGDPSDPRYGLIEPGAMEVQVVMKGIHLYYMNAFAVLGLREAAQAAQVLNKNDDAEMFQQEYLDLRACLQRSHQQTFKRTGLYEGYLWFGTETKSQALEAGGQYDELFHNCLVWPCGAIDPQDPMWTATLRRLDYSSQTAGGGTHTGCPYFGVDRAISYLLRNEPEKTLDYFCAFTDVAGGTFSWGEGYSGILSAGDQPHNWADSLWIILFRNLFVFEDGDTLMLTPALFRRWHKDNQHISAHGLPTYFGVLDLDIQSNEAGTTLDYRFSIAPQGDQADRPLNKIVLSPRVFNGRPLKSVQVNGRAVISFHRDTIILPNPKRDTLIHVEVQIEDY